MVATAALASIPLAREAGAAALQLAQTPVLGWERVETFTKGRKRPRSVVQRSSFTLRAWEVGALGIGAAAIYVFLAFGKASQEGFRLPGNLGTLQEIFF